MSLTTAVAKTLAALGLATVALASCTPASPDEEPPTAVVSTVSSPTPQALSDGTTQGPPGTVEPTTGPAGTEVLVTAQMSGPVGAGWACEDEPTPRVVFVDAKAATTTQGREVEITSSPGSKYLEARTTIEASDVSGEGWFVIVCDYRQDPNGPSQPAETRIPFTIT